MTSHVDSAPYLIQRAGEISLSSRISDALKAKGVTTLAQLAFCVGQPRQVLSPTDFETWSDALLTGMTVGEKASLRRLILEAQTMLVASLKDMAEPSEGAAPKKVGVAERNARMDQLRTQLSGVSLTGQLEPSHALLDMAVQQWADARQNVTTSEVHFRLPRRDPERTPMDVGTDAWGDPPWASQTSAPTASAWDENPWGSAPSAPCTRTTARSYP